MSQFRGFSTFAIQALKFPYRKVIDGLGHLPKPAINVLWGTFGIRTEGIRYFLEKYSDRPHLIEIHLTNEAGRRNKRLFDGELFQKLDVHAYNKALESKEKKVKEGIGRRVDAISEFLENVKNPNTNLVLSTGLEDNFTQKAFDNIILFVKEHWRYKIVRSPVGQSNLYFGSADYLELHGKSPNFRRAVSIFNNDGTELPPQSMSNHFKNYAQGFASYWWLPHLQGILSSSFIQPKKRVFSVTDEQIADFKIISA